MGVPLLACLFPILIHAQTMDTIAETVKVSTTRIFPMIPRGQTSKDFQVLVHVEAPPSVDQKVGRTPIDLVAVLDISDSMNDPAAPPEKKPSRLDLLKMAMKFVINKLDDGDRLSIVAFNDQTVREYSTDLLDVSGDGRSNVEKKVDRLKASGGGTALMPSLEEAVKILDERPGDSRYRVGFIVILTDGDDTSGNWRRKTIHGALSKYPIHTFGFGAAHDPEMLFYIAQQSHGTYSFVDDENLDKVAGALAVCLGGLKTVTSVDTRISLKPAELSGVRIERIDSGGYESSVSRGGASGEIAVGFLYAGEAKHFVVHLHVPASSSVAPGSYCDLEVCHNNYHHRQQQHLLAVGCSYSHGPGASAISIKGHGVFVERPEVGGAGEHGGRQVLPSPVVLQHMVRFDLVEMVVGFAQGELSLVGGAHARDVLQSRWEEFRTCHQFWAGLDLGGVEKDVNAMARSLTTGVAYVLSWVSSHQMQRTATMGSPDKVVAEFLTPAMRTMLEEAQKVRPPATEAPSVSVDQHTAFVDDCVDFSMIEQRLEVWSKKREMQAMLLEPWPATEEDRHLAAVFQEASLQAINRAMHRDIYLAVVHASTLRRRCHSGAGK